MRKLVAFLAGLLGVGCSRPAPVAEGDAAAPKSGLAVTCSPNPCDQHTHPTVPRPPYPFMWFYRTEVRNTLDVPLRITRFEAYVWQGGRWVARNITGRSLTAQDFGEWYPDGVEVVGGVIPPGAVAVDARNWHGSSAHTNGPTKWAYWAVDPAGAEHYAEVVVESVAVRR